MLKTMFNIFMETVILFHFNRKFKRSAFDLNIHYIDKSTGTPPSLEEKKTLPNCGNKESHVLKNCISTSVATVLKCMK